MNQLDSPLALTTAPADADSFDPELGRLLEQITARLIAGECLDLETLAREHREHAESLRELVPAMAAVAGLARPELEAAGAQPHQPPPRELGDFRILREIGRGGMGVVYEAEQLSLGRRVALKVLPFAAMLDERQLARFKNEARAAATLQHTNIVPVYAVGCERGVHYYAMQLVEGRSMAEVLAALRGDTQTAPHSSHVAERHETSCATGSASACPGEGLPSAHSPFPIPNSPFAETAAAALPTRADSASASQSGDIRKPKYIHSVVNLAIQAANALDHAHTVGIVHRDIKPANLLLDALGRLWVTDFGLARIQADAGMTMTGDLVGTLRYMSPEQALAQRVVVDHRTDIYSLGVTLYELLTLQPAFAGADRQEVLRRIAFDEPAPPRKINPAIPADLETIVLKAISKSPDERYATARELSDDLQRYIDQKPITAKPPTIAQRAAKWSRRHTGFIAATAILFAVVAIGSLASTWLITQAFQSESAARRQAQSNLRRGNDAVERLLSRVADERLLNEPALEDLRRSLLLDALEVNNSLVEENSDDPEARFEAAKAYRRAAEIQWELFDNTANDIAARHAVRIGEELSSAFPDDPRFRRELARAYSASTLLGLKDRATIEKSVALHENLLASNPDNPELLFGLGGSLSCLGINRSYSGGERTETEGLFRRSVTIAEQLCTRHPDNLRYRDRLARWHWELGRYSQRHGRIAESKEHLMLGLAESTKVVEQAPRVSLYRNTKAAILSMLSDVCRRAGDLPAALDYADQSKSIALQLVTDYPLNTHHASLLHTALENRAIALEADEQFEAALLEITEIDERFYVEDDARCQNDAAWRFAMRPEPVLRRLSLKIARRASELAPHDTYVMNTLGVALYRTGDCPDAIEKLKESMSVSSEHEAFSTFFLAMAESQLGHQTEARQWYDRAVAWMSKHQPKNEELLRFRAEAEELLGIKPEPSVVGTNPTTAQE
jgi:serine/threonine protein kinase